MSLVSCQIPRVLLGVLDDAGEITALDETRGVQLLALVCAKAANDPPSAEVIPLKGHADA